MISAFGVDHGEISKARRHAGIVPSKRGQNSMQPRGGEGYFNPSSEQIAASKARRAGQAAYKADKPNRRTGGGKKLPMKVLMNQVGELKGLRGAVTTGALAGGGVLLGTHVANRHIRKDQRKWEAGSAAAGGAGGYLLTGAGMNLGGQTAKAKMKQRRGVRGTSANERKIWSQHKAKYSNPTERHLKYPKSLPDWRGQRLLAVKNKPAVGRAALAAGTVAGAAYGVHEARKK